MYTIKTFNKISDEGLSCLREVKFKIQSDSNNPDAIILRSHDLHKETLPDSVLAIGRAGAGVNNIPVQACTLRNIVVFNTPGANANAVKELVLAALFLSSRNIIKAVNFVRELAGTEANLHHAIEEHKSAFKGSELAGRTLGVLGLGAIGMMVANSAVELGLSVMGYDPFISVSRAWELSRSVEPAPSISRLLGSSDYITMHMPLTADTKEFVDYDKLSKVKRGAVLLNFARPEIVNEADVLRALNEGLISLYVTDFPSRNLLASEKVICIPHLGASTAEAENNCAIMISQQIRDYLLDGNISNSVNFPNCFAERSTSYRIVYANKNVPNMVGQVSSVLANHGLNIQEMINKSKDEVAYNIIDLNQEPSIEAITEIKDIEGVLFVRLIK